MRLREGGLALPAAIEKARSSAEDLPATVFAGLRRRRTDLIPAVLTKRTMLGISHAIEDEFCARGEPAALFGSFQRERWRDLARTADTAMVFADFERRRTPKSGPAELPLDRSDPASREWALVCDGEGYAACLAGWELPGQEGVRDMDRRFEALWSVEADVVRDAVAVALALASRSAPDLVDAVPARLREEPPPASEDLRTLVSLTNRMLAYSEATEEELRARGRATTRS